MRLEALLGFVLCLVTPLIASAELPGQPSECVSAYERAQTERRAGKLLAAKASAVQCSAAACPQVLAKDCARWVSEIEPAIPRVVLAAKDRNGVGLQAVMIYLDGQALPNSGGQSIEVDPGGHVLRFEHAGAKPVERRELFVEGEKNHRVTVTFQDLGSASPEAPPAGNAPRPGIAPAAWVAAGIGAAAFVTSAIFGVRALNMRSDLDRSGCKPSCDPDRVVALQRSAAIADIAAAAGLIATGSAVYLLISSEPAGPAPRPASRVTSMSLVYRTEL